MCTRWPSEPISGTLECMTMPFGHLNAPATFQALINFLFRALLNRFALVHLNGVLAHSQTLDDHHLHLRHVLQTSDSTHLHAEPVMCKFTRARLKFHENVLDSRGIFTAPSKVKDAIKELLAGAVKIALGWLHVEVGDGKNPEYLS